MECAYCLGFSRLLWSTKPQQTIPPSPAINWVFASLSVIIFHILVWQGAWCQDMQRARLIGEDLLAPIFVDKKRWVEHGDGAARSLGF